MAAPTTDTEQLTLTGRGPEGSRAARRLRREGLVPGVIYGGGEEPQHFAVDGRVLRNTLARAAQILEVDFEGTPVNVQIKDVQRHPVQGHALHVDLMRIRMDQAIHATVALELTGADGAPGVVMGGVFNQELRELTIEALPGDIPDAIVHDVSGLEINETVTLDAVTVPEGVTLLDDGETVIATITPPTVEPAEEEIETETEVVGDEAVDSVEAEAQAGGDTAEEAGQKADSA